MAGPLFPLGRMVATPGALSVLAAAGENPADLLDRHQSGDWGEVTPEDAKENEFSVEHGFRIISSYATAHGSTVWLITEHDRSQTTILLPTEY